MFRPAPGNVRFPQLEEEVLEFWRSHRIYEQSLERRQNAPPFVFCEGPPTANGLPHPGHCLTRAIKDLFPRYRTMRGYLCQRKAGWDTHGLPVEVEVCKELGIHSKEEIENYGVEPFIQLCQKSVWRYMKEWERLTERLGFWIHLDDAYVTYHQSYVESVWWSLKNLFQRGLLYQGHKIVWWWAQGGTALSSGEVGQGYREVADPSVYVRFPLVDRENTSLLVWTTTPWTLPSNQFSAVHPKIEYALAVDEETGEKLILAAELVDAVAEKAKRMLKVESTFPGTKVVGERYTPPFDYYYKSLGDKKGRLKSGDEQHLAWRVTTADFVTTESGTGVVHEAPAFGEVDFKLLQDEQQRFADNEGPQLLCAVAPDGTFTEEAPDYQGRWVKESDKDICRELRSRGLLYHQEQYLHEYPFCWRADKDPLIQYPRRGWFIRTTEFKERMLANNRQVNWLPDHIRDGRFGNFLETNVDWALSRERFWGTPLPIWACSETGEMEAVAHYDELTSKPGVAGVEVWQQAKQAHPELPEDLKVHKPYIDAVTYDSPFAEGARMQRVPEVIDCWYDSGAMPFAQWGNPQTNRASFDEQFPADFISEALDQTRGWFYSLLAISTLLYGDEQANQPAAKTALDTALAHEFPHPFRTCIVLGLMLAESHVCLKCEHRLLGEVKKCEKCGGKVARRVEKMSKRLRNYREPAEIFDRYGADALRWYFFANQPPWSSIIYSERAIKDSIPEFLLRLWNVYSFFTIYAEIDEFEPEKQLDGFDSESVGKQASELNAAMLQQAATYRPVKQRAELDRWVLSELNQTAAIVTEKMDAYDNFGACQALSEFVDGLSNWFVRRSRDRFWAADKTAPEKLDAYWTLYECLLTTSKMIAPFTPFLAETMWRNLAGVFGDRAEPSVHLCTYPTGEPSVVDEQLSQRMRLLREVVSLALRVRQENKLRVRQPLAKTEVVLANAEHQTWLEEHDALVRDEINVKQVEYIQQAEQYIEYQVRPNFKLLGPKLGKKLPLVKAALEQTDGAKLLAQMNASGSVTIDVGGEAITLDAESLEVRLHAKPGWAAAQGGASVVVLSTELTDELIREGLARDVVRHIQERRKELQCNYTDRIELAVVSSSAELRQAIDENQQYIRGETLAVSFSFDALPNVDGVEVNVSGHTAGLYVTVGE